MTVLDRCQDLHGPLSKSNRTLLGTMLSTPSPEAWRRAQKIVISPMPLITLGMAVKRVTANTDQSVPDPFTVYRALRHAIETRQRYVQMNFEQDPDPL